MRRFHARREESDWLGIAAATTIGVVLGAVAGFLAGEYFGAANLEGVKDAVDQRRRAKATHAEQRALEHTVATALEEHPTTRTLGLTVRARGGQVLELAGTVPDRDDRDLASRVARGAAPHALIVNRVLVAGDGVPDRPVTSNVG